MMIYSKLYTTILTECLRSGTKGGYEEIYLDGTGCRLLKSLNKHRRREDAKIK